MLSVFLSLLTPPVEGAAAPFGGSACVPEAASVPVDDVGVVDVGVVEVDVV
jgi:hypothetical protein